MRPSELTGQRFGRLTVVKRAENSKNGGTRWLCQCDCGNMVCVHACSLKQGDTKSCGCLKSDCGSEMIQHLIKKNLSFKHGDSKAHNMSRLYYVWLAMKDRCRNPNNKNYKNYGGRGITVCDEWCGDYVAFRDWAMANGYEPDAPYGQCTIDRIDVNGNYEPSNCRWVSMAVQSKNKRNKKEKEQIP